MGPFDVAGQVAFGLDIVADGKVADALLKEARSVGLLLDILGLGGQRGGSHLFGIGGLEDAEINGWKGGRRIYHLVRTIHWTRPGLPWRCPYQGLQSRHSPEGLV